MKLIKKGIILLLMISLVAGCSSTESHTLYEAGTYNVITKGHNAEIEMDVTFENDKIASIKITNHQETAGISDSAIQQIPEMIITKQSLSIDTVAGATVTSKAIIKGVEDAVVLAKGNVEELYIDKENVKDEETLTADVIVVGSGLSGMATTISALENGLSVIIVEKQADLGLSFVSSFGNMMIGQVAENKEFHFSESDDTIENFMSRWDTITKTGGSISDTYPNYDRVKNIVIDSAETMQWIKSFDVDLQLAFTYDQRGSDIVRPVSEEGKLGGLELVEKLRDQIKEKAATILTSTTATSLIVEDGVVIGVEASSSTENYKINAKSVVLATGGFGGNDEMIATYIPELLNTGYKFSGTTANIGSGMLMCKSVDAAEYDNSWIVPAPGKISPTKELVTLNTAFSQLTAISSIEGGNINTKLLVDNQGNRFINEATDGTALISEMISVNKAPYYFLFDSSSKEVVNILESGIESDDVFKAETIEELEEMSTLSNLSDTFAKYDEACTTLQDKEYGKDEKMLVSYEDGPYYLVSYVPDFVATLGGVITNDEYSVLNNEMNEIQGLYAVGELTHRFLYDRAQFGNISNGASLTMGKQLGEILKNK